MFSRASTGTPVPPPRRTGSRLIQSRVDSPPVQRATSVLHQEVARSRLGRQSTPDISRDYLHAHAKIFSHSDQLTIAFAGTVPREVEQLLAAADLYNDQFAGEVDSLTGYALILSTHTIFVWQPVKPSMRAAITCYMFPVPTSASSTQTHLALPVASLVHYGSMREPGLIVISKMGELRLWESIGVGLSGAEGFSTTQLPLQADEDVVSVQRCDHLLYIAATSAGRLFRLIVSASGHVVAAPFRLPPAASNTAPSGQSFWSYLRGSGPTLRPIVATTLGTRSRLRGTQEFWVLTEDSLLRWHVSLDGAEQCDLHMELSDWLVQKWQTNDDDPALVDPELLDVVVAPNGVVTLLISHQGMDSDGPQRHYDLVELKPSGNALELIGNRGLSYEYSRLAHSPRLTLVDNGAAILVQFSDAIVLSFRGTVYQELARLKKPTDRIFGASVVQGIGSGNDVSVLMNDMMLAVTVGHAPKAQADDDDMGASLLRAVMIRSLVYGPVPDNPLSFRFPSNPDGGNLMAASEQLSGAVLASDPTLVKPVTEINYQLEDRMSRLSFLIHFINSNGVTQKLSPSSRQKLLYDAEQLYAAQELWAYYSRTRREEDPSDIFVASTTAYMQETGAPVTNNDTHRSFFRVAVSQLPALLARLAGLVRERMERYENRAALPAILVDVDRIVLLVLHAAHTFRDKFAPNYGLDTNKTFAEPWTSTEGCVSALRALFDETDRMLQSVGDREDDLRKQLCELAAELLSAYTERLEWLKWANREGAGREREQSMLDEQFKLLRPQTLRTLVLRGCVDEAFELAEEHRDYRTLTELCHERLADPSERYEVYIEKYQEVYAFDLYSYWIERGMGPALFLNAERHSALVDQFFRQNDAARLSWIHDLTHRRYEQAAGALLVARDGESTVAGQQLMLSLGKLAMLAETKPGHNADPEKTKPFDQGLDFIAVQQELAAEFRDLAMDKTDIEHMVDDIMAVHSSKLEVSRPHAFKLFRGLVRLVMQGRVLEVEDLVDVMTLKDNAGDTKAFTQALTLLNHAQLPEARQRLAVHNIWRRILMHDDWDAFENTSHMTDNQLKLRMQRTALYTTLRVAAEAENIPLSMVPLPQFLIHPPLEQDIEARWPGFTPTERQQLLEDFTWECAQLRSVDIARHWDEVARREQHDRESMDDRENGDEQMMY